MATTNKRQKHQFNFDQVKRFKALHFNILDDHRDPQEHRAEDLNRYFTSPSILPVTTYAHETIAVDMQVDAKDGDDDPLEDTEVTSNDAQQQLSQQMNDLSVKPTTTTTAMATTTSKKMKVADRFDMNDISYDRISLLQEMTDRVPTYLMAGHPLFEHRIKQLLDNPALASTEIDDLRQIAIVKHHGCEGEQRKRLLLVYLQSVKGTLKETWPEPLTVDRQFVPPDVQAMASDDDKENMSYRWFERLLQQRIQQIDDKSVQLQQQLATLKKQCSCFNLTLEEWIDQVIEHEAMQYIRLKCDALIALVGYDYDAAILDRQYLAEKPSLVQQDTTRRLYALRFDAEKARRILMEWKQSVLEQRVPKELQAKMVFIVQGMEANASSSVVSNRYEQLVRQRMTEYMAECIADAERNFNQCRQRVNVEIDKIWQQHHNQQLSQAMPKALTDIIEKRFVNITDRLRVVYNYRMASPLVTPSALIGFGPCLSIQTSHTLTKKQLQLLNRGPTYVIPCQSVVKSDKAKELYGPLKQQLTRLFAKHHVNLALSMDIHKKLWQHFDEQFSPTIPIDLQQRSSDEKRVMSSIRRLLEQGPSNSILRRTADNMNTFYLGDAKEFNDKSIEFMVKTDLYEFQQVIDEKKYGTEWQKDVYEMIESLNFMLRRVHEKKGIDSEVLKQLTVDPATIKLPYLYFLPQINRDQTLSVVPIIAAYESPTWLLGRFLDRLLRPVVRRVMQRIGVDDETTFAVKLRQFYQSRRLWTTNTLLVTIHVKNFYAMASHSYMTDVLEYFLLDHLAGRSIDNISILRVQNLVQIFLSHNMFAFGEKIYKCAKGSPTTMPLTETLANIFLCNWQKGLVREVATRQQFICRHQQDIFFTWAGPEDELQDLVDALHKHDTNVELEVTTGRAVRFMNTYIENRSGLLYTRVDHSNDHQQYTLPYMNHHSIEDHSDWLRFSLLRAVCCSTLVADFIRERLYLEMTYLTNGYTLYYIEQRVDHFFNYFNMISMRYSPDQKLYDQLRAKILAFVEQRQDSVHKIYQYEDDRKLFHFHYLYEYGPRSTFNETFHRLWTQFFKQDRVLSVERAKIMLTTKHQYSLNAFLGQPKAHFRTLTEKKKS